MRQEFDNLEELKRDINYLNTTLRLLFSGFGILGFESIKKLMTKELYIEFENKFSRLFIKYSNDRELAFPRAIIYDYVLLDWLGLIKYKFTNAPEFQLYLKEVNIFLNYY